MPGALPDNDQEIYGAPTAQDSGAVNPMMTSASGGTQFGNANPFSHAPFMEEGGAIPDSDDSSPSDHATNAISKALSTVNRVLMYGRQKNGLPAGGGGRVGGRGGGGVNLRQSSDSGGPFGEQSNLNPQSEAFGEQSNLNPQSSAFGEQGSSSGSDQESEDDSGSYAEGGAVPEDGAPDNTPPTTEDLSGATAPVIPDSGAGIDLSLPDQPKTPFQDTIAGTQGVVKRVMNYLMGGDAMSPQQFDQYMAQTREMASTPSENTLLAIQAAADEGGPDAGFAAVQHARQKYDLNMGHARAAANGVDGKPADMRAAANSANQAMANLPDGNEAKFDPSKAGVTVTVNGEQPVQLTPEQMNQLFDVGNVKGGGQFDAVLERGLPDTIKAILEAPRGTMTVGQKGAGFSGGEVPKPEPRQDTNPGKVTIFGGTNGPTNGWGERIRSDDPRTIASRLANEKRDRIAEIEAKNKGAIAVQQEKNKGGAAGNNRLAVEQARQEGLNKRAADTNARLRELDKSRSDLADRRTAAQLAINETKQRQNGITPEQIRDIYAHYGLNQAPQSPQPAQQQVAPVPGAKFYQGKWYTRGPNGEAVPVQ